jgi:ribosome maturation factor RimP
VEMAQVKRTSRIEDEILALIEPEVLRLGFQLWELLWIPSQRILRVFISKPDLEEAVSLDDCQRVSRGIDGIIDASQILQDRYYLEVSSLGESPYIRTWVQLARFKDRKLEFTDLNGKKKTGTLQKVEQGGSFVWRPDGHLKKGVLTDTTPVVKSNISEYQRIRAKKVPA